MIFMEMYLLALVGETIGGYFIGGEIISCLLTSLILTYSSKVILISCTLKLVLKFFGTLERITGGRVSFKPPVMLPLFAQLITDKAKIIYKNANRILNIRK